MVSGGLVLVKPSFSREKDGFWMSSPGKTIFFSRKDGFSKDGCSKQSSSREKDGFEPKNHLFLEKTKKTKKPSFPKLWGWGLQEMVFLVFSRKGWFFWFETIFISRKRWFLSSRSSKNHLFLEKKMVFGDLVLEKPSFSREKDGFWRSCPGKTIFFSRKRWFLEVLSW